MASKQNGRNVPQNTHTNKDTDNEDDENDEDDYMNMKFEDELIKPKQETSLQRKQRLKKEAEVRGRTKSKKELEAEQERTRETALDTAISSSNKGFRMLAKLGYKPGDTLGPTGSSGVVEPIRVIKTDGKAGIGLLNEKKRKLKEEVENIAKRAKESETEYADRVRNEFLEKRREGQVFAAQKITEKLDVENDEAQSLDTKRPTMSLNVLWRGLARQRLIKEHERRMRHDLLQSSLSKLPVYDDHEEDIDDKTALGKDIFEEELVDEEDEEVEAFDALTSEEKLQKLLEYLRTTHYYCFWCKYRYPDAELEGCPGINEDDHD